MNCIFVLTHSPSRVFPFPYLSTPHKLIENVQVDSDTEVVDELESQGKIFMDFQDVTLLYDGPI